MKKSILSVLSILVLTLALNSCNVSKKPGNIENKEKLESGYTVSYPTTVSGALHNKGMGWITLEEQTNLGKLDLGHNGDLPEVDNVGIQTCWDFLEPVEGEFNWTLVDQTIDYWTSKGKRINFRICTDSLSLPEVFVGAPRWLNEEPYNVHYEEYTYSGTVMARANDLTDPTYQKFFERFLKELSDRYATNPYIDTIDIRGFGMFGEWHSGHSFANMEERMFTLAYIVDKYAENFAKEGKTLFLSNSWDYQGVNQDGSSAAAAGNSSYEDYLIWSALDHGMKLEYVGFRRDGLAGNGVTKYATDEKALVELVKSGKNAVNCGEFFTGFSSYIDGLYGMDPVEATEELLFKSRCNYSTVMGWANIEVVNIIEQGYEEVFNRGNNKMGYRLKVDMAKYPSGIKQGRKMQVISKISNSGVGKFSLANHYYQLMLVDENGNVVQRYSNEDYDLRKLLNGETLNVYSEFEVDSSLKDGKYTLACAIVDENNNPSIRLAQVGGYETKVYPLGEVNLGNYKKLDNIFEKMSYDDATSYKFKSNRHYEITFDYTPSVKLKDYLYGDENGYKVQLKSSKDTIDAAIFQDVSQCGSYKTVSVATNDSTYKLSISGSGIYQNQIAVGDVIIEEKTGYLEKFEDDYDLLSFDSPWYCDNGNALIVDENSLAGETSVLVAGELPHTFNDGLTSDYGLLSINKNTSYTISFKTKGYSVGGNACYYYLKLKDADDEEKIVGEWYDRPDETMTTKTFTFNTPNAEGLHLVFGVKNVGSYLLDDINIVKNFDGFIVNGEDVKDVNNERKYDEAKLENGYVEGFENMVLNDSTFTYGFNRWGGLTADPSEVISGNLSMSSRLDEFIYDNVIDSNWFEFMYSNSKYIKLEKNTEYTLKFKYKIVEHIYLHTDASLDGYAYCLARSKTSADEDCPAIQFARIYQELDHVYEYTYTFTTGDSDDYYIIIGMYGRGVIIVDDISVTKN